MNTSREHLCFTFPSNFLAAELMTNLKLASLQKGLGMLQIKILPYCWEGP